MTKKKEEDITYFVYVDIFDCEPEKFVEWDDLVEFVKANRMLYLYAVAVTANGTSIPVNIDVYPFKE